MEGTGAEVEFYQYVISIIGRQSMCVWARWAGFCNVFRLLGLCERQCWLLAASPLLSFSHQFWTGSKICSSGSSATSRLYCWYFVTLARLLLLPCYYPYKKQTILYIAADNVLDHDLILFRIYIYSASGGVLEGDHGLLSGSFRLGLMHPEWLNLVRAFPGILGTENQVTWQFS